MFDAKHIPRVFQGMFAILVLSILSPAADKPNVAAIWTISVSGAARAAEQTIKLIQSENKITGTFRGPRQTGPLEGKVEGNNIKVPVATGVPIDSVGTVDSDSLEETLSARGTSGDWIAKRTK